MASKGTAQRRHRTAAYRKQPETTGSQKLVNAVRDMLPGRSKSKGKRGSLPLVGDLLAGGSKGRRHSPSRGRGAKPALMGAAGAGVAGAAAYATRRKRASRKEEVTPVGGPV